MCVQNMHKRSKQISILFLVICLVMLSACGQKETNNPEKHNKVINPAESVEAIRTVLLGEQPFYLEGQETFINEINVINGQQFNAPLEIVAVASVDFDHDEIMEAVVELTNQMNGWQVVLHYYDAQVYGYGFDFRSMQEVYDNGVVSGSNGADSTEIYQLTFDKGNIIKKETAADANDAVPVQWYDCSGEIVSEVWSEEAEGDLTKSETGMKLLNYAHAYELLEIGDYDSALLLFESVGDFKDADRHADGIRCMEYASQLSKKLSTAGDLTSEWLMGATITCDYSPGTFTFTQRTSFSKSGLYGWAFALGSAIGELDYNEIDPNGMKSSAEDIYYDYFYQEGFPGIICVAEWYDEVNDTFLSGTYSGFDDVPSANGIGNATLEEVQQYANSRYFVVEDGVLREYCGSKAVVTIPEGIVAIGEDVFGWNETIEEVYMPSTLKRIDAGAFFQCSNLKKVSLNDGLEQIGYKAFYKSRLATITIPGSVIKIEAEALDACRYLTDIYYEGTMEQWKNTGADIWSAPYQEVKIHTSEQTNGENSLEEPDTNEEYCAVDLIGLSINQISQIYGSNYSDYYPEGDPPYIFYETGCPYVFFPEDMEDETSLIMEVRGNSGAEIAEGICVGDSLDDLASAFGNLPSYQYNEINSNYGHFQDVSFEVGSRSVYVSLEDSIITGFQCF